MSEERRFKIPAAFQALTGELQGWELKTSVKFLEEEGDSEEAKAAAQAEFARLIERIELIAEPVIAHAGKENDKYVLGFSFEHAKAVASVEVFKALLEAPTAANPSVRFDIELVEKEAIL